MPPTDVSATPAGDRSGSSLPDAVRVLLVEDNEEYARLVERTLDRASSCRFEVEHEERLDAALGRIEQRDYDVMLVDLGLPDGYGAFTLGSACAVASHLPVLVLTGNDDEQLAIAAVRSGAQEYLVKDRVDRRTLAPTILRAIERHRRMGRIGAMKGRTPPLGASLGRAAPPDPFTGLVDETIFCDRLNHAIACAERRGESLALMLLQHDEFFAFKTLFGDDLARRLLRTSALRLGRLVRKSDTAARIGGEAFAVILGNAPSREAIERLGSRMLDALTGEDLRDESGLEIAGVRASIGVAIYPEGGATLEALVESAAGAHQTALGEGGGRLRFHGEGRRDGNES